MVSETYVEYLVAKKPSFGMSFLKNTLIVLTVCFVLIGFLMPLAYLLAIATGIGAYFAHMNADIEYEYLYLDKEISIDKVMAKSKRKRVAVYDMERLEILAPINSHRLDSYRNHTMKMADFSSGAGGEQDKRYMMIYDGNLKVILEPSAEIVKAVQMIAPRKVFTD